MSDSVIEIDSPIGHSNGTQTKTKITNGSVIEKRSTTVPPEIPHISNNIIPLSNILKFYTQEAFKQLSTVIENLSSTQDSENDSTRKKKFLETIISLRQDFVKIYTLVKWSASSKDVSKLIDLLNWCRMQEFHFDQLAIQLNGLTGYSGAKLPNSDLITSLEVFFKGRPQLPSYNYIPIKKISPEKTLEVLSDLNLILITRLALIDIPKRLSNNYIIKDGRVYFSVPNEFEVSITVANDLIIDTDEEYYKSPFYFIDFKFLFGINPETSLITHTDNKIVTKLPKSSHQKLEKTVNNILLNQGLYGLYDVLHKYSISFKLYLIAKQLKELLINTRWRNNLQVNYQTGKSLVIVNYWSTHFLSKNWRSFLELGIDKSYNLNFRWFKNGKYNINQELIDALSSQLKNSSSSSNDNSENNDRSLSQSDRNDDDSQQDLLENNEEHEDLNVDLILNVIVNKHSALIMEKVFNILDEKLNTIENPDQVSYLSPQQLLLKLSPNKSTIFCINPLTGFFYFIDPSPLQNVLTKRINSPPTVVKNKNFISEADMVNNIIDNLIQLRLEVYNKEINNKLLTTEWINNDIIVLGEYEVSKLSNFLVNGLNFTKGIHNIKFYRRKNWPSSWFLISLISGISSTSYWWVARLKSISGEWKIQWIQKLKFQKNNHYVEDTSENQLSLNDGVEPSSFNYEFFSSLSTSCSNMIIDHMILEELQARNIRFLKTDSVKQILEKFNISEIPEDEEKKHYNGDLKLEEIKDNEDEEAEAEKTKPLVYESIILIYNHNDLLPIYNSSTSLFLKIKLINANNVTQMKLKLFGNLRNLSIKNSPESFLQLNLKIDEVKNYFEIYDLINLSSRLNETGTRASSAVSSSGDSSSNDSKNGLLDKVFNNLNKLNKLIKILDQLNKGKIKVVENTVNDITISLHENLNNLIIKLPEKSTEGIQIVSDQNSKREVSPEFSLVLTYLNRYLSAHVGDQIPESENANIEDAEAKDSASIIGIIACVKELDPVLQSILKIRSDIAKSESTFKMANGLSKLNFDVKIPNLNNIQYIFYLYYVTVNSAKKIFKDKLVINLSFKRNKFDVINRNLIKISLKDNLNSKNIKHKKLFELIFKSINDYDLEYQSSKDSNPTQIHTPSSVSSSNGDSNSRLLIKLNYDFLVSSNVVEELMVRIGNCFIQYLQAETR
ncbi:mediator complex subunit MED14-domain-containing protein [Scheffersomyces coipomensis]|uniref:mediator complex subunit MED14-domain-containing protein n=1 Tax=Scheffersomyces coipomensis TaxID=1788519 RepID=UPI00315D5759